MNRRHQVVAAVGVLVLGGWYTAADVMDAVPGVWTTKPAPLVPQPAPIPPALASFGGNQDNRNNSPATVDLATVAAPLATDAPQPDAAGIEQALQPILADPTSGLGPSYSISVAEAMTGNHLYGVNENQAMETASVAKVLTAFAGVHALGPQHRTRTATVLDGSTVVMLGAGDVLLAADAGDPAAINGHAGLGDLARDTAAALHDQGQTTVTVELADGQFAGPTWAPGWGKTDGSAGFVAAVTSVAVNAGRLTDYKYAQRHQDPGLAAMDTFVTHLQTAGITVTGEPRRRTDGASGEELAAVESATMADVATYILQTSDNTAAEAVARQVALSAGKGTTFADAGQAVLAAVADTGVDTQGAQLTDGSGLGEGTSAGAKLITSVLTVAASPDHPQLRSIITGLPVAGVEGTLADRFVKAPAALGVAQAKTGTLTGVTALAGVVRDQSGRLLVFTILANEVTGTVPGRVASDELVAALAQCGCRG